MSSSPPYAGIKNQIELALDKKLVKDAAGEAKKITDEFITNLPRVHALLLKDVEFSQFEYEGRKYIQQDFIIVGEYPSVKNVLVNTVLDSASIVQMVRLSLVDLVTGKYGMKEVSGPIGTISAIAESTAEPERIQDKLLTALNFLSMITINVGMFNLLPVPALDGGRLFFIVIEMIRRKPIPAKNEGYIHAAGLVVLLGFMIIISISDIIKQF